MFKTNSKAKSIYVAPQIALVHVEVENNLAAGSPNGATGGTGSGVIIGGPGSGSGSGTGSSTPSSRSLHSLSGEEIDSATE